MFHFKFDKVNAFFVGAYVAADLLESAVAARRAARVDAVNKDFDERERLLKAHLALLEAELKAIGTDQDEDDLSWM